MLFLLVVASCSRRGCTNSNSENYEPSAKKDCGCCVYVSKGQVWAEYDVQDRMQKAGIAGLKFYADGELVGGTEFRSPPSFYLPYSEINISLYPYTNFTKDNGNILVVNLGSEEQKEMNVIVANQNNDTIWQNTVLFQGGKMSSIQIWY